MNNRPEHRPHWYKYVIHDCPVCGGEIVKKRVYGNKPKDIEDRVKTLPSVYDGCLPL